MEMKIEAIRGAVERRAEELCRMSDQIFDWQEVGLEEYRSSELLEDYLERNGFAVERGVGGLKTAFRAVYRQGEGGPSFGLLAEYDALEKIGHGCGHHMQGPAIAGAALAVKELCGDRPYAMVVYGTPAEETCGGKTIMLENGCFQDIDIALMMHASPDTCVDVKCMASREYTVRFDGVKSHAAMYPEKGRSAFDAALLAFQGIEFLREHVAEDTRMHYTVRDAGGPSNVVPDRCAAEFVLRSYSTDYLETLIPRFTDILKGACLMTGTSYEITDSCRFYGKIPCYRLNDLIMEYAACFEAPQLAPPRERTGSTDFGIVMYHVPGCCIRTAFVPRGTAAHSQEYLEAGKSEAAHRAVCLAAGILAGVCADLLENPQKLVEIKGEFAEAKERRQ